MWLFLRLFNDAFSTSVQCLYVAQIDMMIFNVRFEGDAK